MIPVDQDKFGPVEGNCWAACLATIFGLPLSDVGISGVGPGWIATTREWLLLRGYTMLVLGVGEGLDDARRNFADIPAPVIVCGPAERGCSHATVWCAGKMVHDPHPSRAGLLSVNDVCVFLALTNRVEPIAVLGKAGAK